MVNFVLSTSFHEARGDLQGSAEYFLTHPLPFQTPLAAELVCHTTETTTQMKVACRTMRLTVCREESGVPPQINHVLLGRGRPDRCADQNL